MNADTKLYNIWESKEAWERDLATCNGLASTPWEHTFLSSIEEKYKTWDMQMFMSEAQYQAFERILNKET